MVEVRKAVQAAGIDYNSADVAFVPTFGQVVSEREVVEKIEKLVDALEESDDVQNVYTNVELSPELQAEMDAED